MNYCKKIANNEWTENDRVDAYEECLENAINTSKKDGYEYTRLTMAQQMYEVLEAMNEAG